MAATLGHAREVAFGASGGASTQQILCNSCTLGKRATHVEPEEMPGSRFKRADSVAEGTIGVDGTVTWNPRADELTDLLPFIVGGAKTGSDPYTYDEAETLPTMVWDVNKHSAADAFRYDACKVNRAVFASDAQSQLLSCALDIIGSTDEADGTTMPTLTPSVLRPLLHRQMVLTLGGTAYKVGRLELEINNNLNTSLYLNDQVLTEIPEGVATVMLRLQLLWDATNKTAFYEKAVAGFTGTNTIVYTRGTNILTFTLGACQRPEAGTPLASRNDPVMWDVELEVREDIGNTVDAIALGLALT